MKILVTGATGFVGKRLVWRLFDTGHAVYPVVRRDINSSEELPGTPVKVSNIDASTDWSQVLLEMDVVVHLAARVHVMKENAKDPLAEFRSINTSGTVQLAMQAAKAGVKRFIYISSVKVNGESTTETKPFTEDDIPAPQDAYGISKWEAEQELRRIAKATQLEVVILRPPLVYGPQVGGNFLTMLNCISKGIPLPLGKVKNKRSMIYVGNLVEAIATCVVHPAAANKTFLLSDKEVASTPELIKSLGEVLQKPVCMLPCPPNFLRYGASLLGKKSIADRLLNSLEINTSFINKELGWYPPYSLSNGLRETANWYKSLAKK